MQSDHRYEIKFVFPEADLPTVKALLARDGSGALYAFPDRQINSIYFDSSNFDDYADSVDGLSQRRKCRFRWYGNSLDSVVGRLELKDRVNNLGSKTVTEDVLIKSPIFDTNLSGLKQIILGQIDGLPHMALHSREPVIHIAYRREYLRNSNNIRFTIDRGITGRFVFGGRSISGSPRIRCPNIVVLEIKSPPNSYDTLSSLIGRLQMTRTRLSKYCLLIQQAYYGITYHSGDL